ncbi:MAG: sulfurtransferase-like selenium metabolism protein YedF [Thermodesulfobacteriota bacterium]
MSRPITVDARGLQCPQPVLLTKKAMEDNSACGWVVLVDNPTSTENVSRFARNQGFAAEVREESSGQYSITVLKTDSAAGPQQELLPCPAGKTVAAAERGHVVYIGTNSMGSGDEELGRKLMRGFLRTWIDIKPLPWRMVFINSGVKLTSIDEEAVEAISILGERGVEILSCGTCIEYFGLSDKLRVGRVTNMYEVIETLTTAAKVISPS